MELDKVVVEKLIEVIVGKSLEFFYKKISDCKRKEDVSATINQGLKIQITKGLNFCNSTTMFKLPSEASTADYTVALHIKNQHRHFYRGTAGSAKISEEDLITDCNNHIILGDPGAGKTTTIKRLMMLTYDKLFSSESQTFPFSFPVVVRLGEIKPGETFFTFLCNELGIKYDTTEYGIQCDETVNIINYEHPHRDYENLENNDYITTSSEVVISKNRVIRKHTINDFAIENAVSDYMNELKIILFVDGLDEVHFELKEDIFTDIKKLSNLISASKIILSSRYMPDIYTFKQFKKNEILPLTDEEARTIAELWIDDVNDFFTKLHSLPYRDLADRPLFLYLLLVLYRNNKRELPEQSIDIYRQIVLLVIREWDDDREYPAFRHSKYKKFDTYKKEDFLSELAFYLTYKLNAKKVFNLNQLNEAYNNIYSRYPGLKNDDGKSVIEDIETHNGLVIKSSGVDYEFSHLSLQEYLCAKYILNVPFTRKHYQYFNVYPAPLAIANVLSPAPGEWFSTLILQNIDDQKYKTRFRSDKMFEFLDRLILENLALHRPEAEIGLSLLYLFDQFYNNIDVTNVLGKFCSLRFMSESIDLMKPWLAVESHSDITNHVVLRIAKNTSTEQYINIPKTICLLPNILDRFHIRH
ncbi:hypothetical protein L4X63_16355 [Geomonas sp. Red32]|uniref:NACHT domain-containing protein n=1 Tax=Geomonas sp. Red32 TaxID=2912856 RepID=UPI00202CECED|nr:hypothetical protein [Geomonas sp. Red32]MCM0083158.1 hypothetical protein [Geomonas sp. Red32]